MMLSFDVDVFFRPLRSARNLDDIGNVLQDVCRLVGARYYAITQHVDPHEYGSQGFRIHNYPEGWALWFDDQRLGRVDPVHRASQKSLIGFRWSSVPTLISLSPRDGQILDAARGFGLGGGFTVPANVPGEMLGSCSFVAANDDDLDESVLPYAQLAGQFAFETVRRMSGPRRTPAAALTDRQLECILWVGRGKTDWEIAQILGVSPNTVIEHLRNARARYAASSRAMLPVRALFDGALSFADIFRR